MGIWDGLDRAEVFEKGKFFKPGCYVLRIKNCIDKNTRKSGRAFIVEFEVIESTDHANHAPGTSASWFQKMTDLNVALGAVKEFMAAVYQCDLRDKTQKDDFERRIAPQLPAIATAATEKNSLTGQVVRLEVTMVKTQKNLDFSRHSWSPYKAGV